MLLASGEELAEFCTFVCAAYMCRTQQYIRAAVYTAVVWTTYVPVSDSSVGGSTSVSLLTDNQRISRWVRLLRHSNH